MCEYGGDDILAAIEVGRSNRLPRRPKPSLPDPQVAERYNALHLWRKEQGEKRGLDSNLVLARQTLWELAEQMPADKDELAAIDGVGAWRLRTYGDDILKLLDLTAVR